ncbi:MAG: hypothetical protein SF172_16360 [Burkholderiales bacterium]|nr:hypothetical protein [Burkholderiales bacterium]
MNAARLFLTGLIVTCAAAFAQAPATPTAEGEAERMLAAIGGRAAWAAVKNTVNDSQQNRAGGEFPVVRAVITIDFEKPRVRIETRGPNLDVVRVIDGDKQWRRMRDGKIAPIPDDVLADDRKWYAGHVYRTIHRIAARDAAISLRLGKDGRLEVVENGARIAWFKLDPRGEPYNFGAHENDTGSISGPWDFEHGGIRHPLWVSNPDGTWRANIKTLAINVPLKDEMFARPAK